jgi:hypothetical protein
MTITYSANEFGDITLENGVSISLTQQAYLAGTSENPQYQAAAVDADGNGYLVMWTPYGNFMEFDDESDCCDWDKYTVIAN